MEEAQIILERHEQQIKAMKREISDLKAVQVEIRAMNEALVTLATDYNCNYCSAFRSCNS